jgi:hypothetical protein
MATHTLVTNANLTAVTFLPGYGSGISAADIATIANNIKRQQSQGSVPLIIPGAFPGDGHLYLPGNRGVIQLLPGDIVAVDTNWGWPIVVSKESLAAASSPWTFT